MRLAKYPLVAVVGAALGLCIAALHYEARVGSLRKDLDRAHAEARDRCGQAEQARQENARLAEQLADARERAEGPIQQLQEYRARPHLRVVTDVDRTAVQITREEGERDLMDLALTSDVEDMWVYYEKDGKGYWENVGSSESERSVLLGVPLSEFADARNVTLYHIHPISYVKHAAEHFRCGLLVEGPDSLRRFGRGEMSEQEFLNNTLLNSSEYTYNRLPSFGDYLGRYQRKRCVGELDIDLQPERVVGASTVFMFDTTPEMDRLFGSQPDSVTRKRYYRWRRSLKGGEAVDDLVLRVAGSRSLENDPLLLERFRRFLEEQ